VTYRWVWDLMIEFMGILYTPLETKVNYSPIADLHTLQFNVTHPFGLSDFTSRILATYLSQSHCNFKSHVECSFHTLIPFLPLFCNCQTNSISLLPTSCLGRLASRNSTLHFMLQLPASEIFITTLHGPHRKRSLSLVRKVCLQRRCIATEVTRMFLAYSLPQECVY
jgi:hypothetical protein